MSALTVLQQVAAVVQTVTGIGAVYQYEPTGPIDPSAYPVVLVWIGQIREERQGYGGATGQGRKWVYYTVNVEVRTVSVDPATGQANFYALVDSIRAKLRGNQTLGSTVRRFGEDIAVTLDFPEANGTVVQYRATLTSTALEEIIG